MKSASDHLILIIGAGNMGTSIAKGLLANQWYSSQITFCEKLQQNHQQLLSVFPDCNIVSDPTEIASQPSIVLLAVKPDDMESVCQILSNCHLSVNTLYISIAAGVPVSAFQRWLGDSAIIVRCMPNTPASIGLGMTGLFTMANTSSAHKHLADEILLAIGKTIWVDKELMLDAITALSGSGPAYLFYLMECLQKSGKSLGLSSEDSYTLTLQTMLGAAQLAQEQAIEFETLRANVTSKGGTTEQAINCFIQNDMRNIVDDAVHAAANRATEISQSFNKE